MNKNTTAAPGKLSGFFAPGGQEKDHAAQKENARTLVG